MAGASRRSRTGKRIELPAGPGFRFELRPLPLSTSFCGVWDTHLNDWAVKPNRYRKEALTLCRKANEDWANGVEDASIAEPGDGGCDGEAPAATSDATGPDGGGGDGAAAFTPDASDGDEAVARARRARGREMLVKGFVEDFERRGREAIATVRNDRPHDYLRMFAALLREEAEGADGDRAVSEIRGILVRPPR